jgi:pyridoxine 5-phosphate synthase
VVELHTGAYAEAALAGLPERLAHELGRLMGAAAHGDAIGLEIHAGHGLDEQNVGPVAAIPEIIELNIGHALIGTAIFVGLGEAVRAMRAAMERARAGAARPPRLLTRPG